MAERMYLMGDEDCGVSLYCAACWDGGRPLAYYDAHGSSPCRDAAVENTTTIGDLVAALRRHDRDVHGITATTAPGDPAPPSSGPGSTAARPPC